VEHDAAALLWLDAWRECPRRPALQREVVRQMEVDLTDILDRGIGAGQVAGTVFLNYPVAAEMLLRTTELDLLDG
jgi:hypothetical protein